MQPATTDMLGPPPGDCPHARLARHSTTDIAPRLAGQLIANAPRHAGPLMTGPSATDVKKQDILKSTAHSHAVVRLPRHSSRETKVGGPWPESTRDNDRRIRSRDHCPRPGAACSLLNEHIFDEICKQTKRPRLIQPKALVCGLGGKTLEVVGETEIAIDGAGPVKVLVTRGLAHQLIIGCDAIIQGHGHMNFVTNTLKWYTRSMDYRPTQIISPTHRWLRI